MYGQTGQSMSELAAGLIVAIPIILLLIDCVVLLIGVVTNDSACRDAARAAASGPPGSYLAGENRSVPASGAPRKRAEQVIKQVYHPSGYLKIKDEVNVTENVQDPVPEPAIGGAINGDVTVETTAEVYPPFLVGQIAGGKVQIRKAETYSYTYVRPAGES